MRAQTPSAYLISIKDADKLIGGDGGAGRIDVGEAVVQVGRLPIHLARRPLPPTHVHYLWAHLLTPAHARTVLQQCVPLWRCRQQIIQAISASAARAYSTCKILYQSCRSTHQRVLTEVFAQKTHDAHYLCLPSLPAPAATRYWLVLAIVLTELSAECTSRGGTCACWGLCYYHRGRWYLVLSCTCCAADRVHTQR